MWVLSGLDYFQKPDDNRAIVKDLPVPLDFVTFRKVQQSISTVFDNDCMYDLMEMEGNGGRLHNFWLASGNNDEQRPPEFFIDWALSKRIRPDWLDWAIDTKLYTPKKQRNLPAITQNTPTAPEFDKVNPTYPPELAIALEAWRAVSTSEGKGKPKARIKAWLETNAPKLSKEAKERIATVANWEKLGGATRSD